MLVQTVFLIFSIILTLLFFVYGFNHYYLLSAARRYKVPALPADTKLDKPRVAIHLPIYNEKYVVHRLISACVLAVENYGIDRARIVIIDDSDDDTVGEIDRVVADLRAKQFEIAVLRRSNRQGYKAGALQLALEQADEELIAVFDADFTPTPDFLVRCVPYFIHNEKLGIIQSRWTHINREYNVLTRAIAIGIDVHFLIEQTGRFAGDCLQNFNGSGGILRTNALVEAGGWQADTLAEDLDASYRIQLLGYRVLYLRDVHSPGEIPPTVPSYKKQQGRWACGSLQTAKKLLPTLLSDRKFGFIQRVEAFIHLTGYLVHPLMFFSFMLACLTTLLGLDVFRIGDILTDLRSSVSIEAISQVTSLSPRYLVWSLVGLLIVLCTFAAWIPPLVVLRKQSLPPYKMIPSMVILFFLGFGVSLSNTIEAGKALFTDKHWEFKRTPKYAVQYGKDRWREKRYQVSLDIVSLVELFFVCLGGISIAYSIWKSNYGILLILIPFTCAYAFVFLLTLLQSRKEQMV